MSAEPTNQMLSLSDLFIIIYRRRKLWLISFCLLLVLSVLVVALHKPKYTFIQRIILTHYYKDNQVQPVVAVDAIVSQLKGYQLPAFVEQYNEKHPDNNISLKSLKYRINSKNAPTLLLSQQGEKNTLSLQIFSELNQFVFTEIQKLERPYVVSFSSNLNKNIEILKQEIPSLQHLRKLEAPIDSQTDKHNMSNLQTLRDVYISTLGLKSKYDELYNLKSEYEASKQVLASIKPLSFDKQVVTERVQGQLGSSQILVVGLLLSFIFSALLVFLVEFLAIVKEKVQTVE